MSREITNLEYDKNCPSFENLPWSDQHCLYHALKPSHLRFSCALNNAQRLRHYLLQNTENLSRSPEMEDFVQNSTTVEQKALQPDFKGKMYVDCYHSLFSGCGIYFLNDGNAISRTDYPNGYCLFAFDLTPNISANKMTDWNLIKHGSVRLDVRFDSALTSTISVIVYALVRDRPRNQCVTAGHC